jgi:hypothetical protein
MTSIPKNYICALISRLYDVKDKSGLLEVFYEEFISTRKITPKKIRKETVQFLYNYF